MRAIGVAVSSIERDKHARVATAAWACRYIPSRSIRQKSGKNCAVARACFKALREREGKMKAVLISIQPKWCELIASGKKWTIVKEIDTKKRKRVDKKVDGMWLNA